MPSLRPVRGQLLDMFPNTGHYEVLTLLERAMSARDRLEEERRRTTQRLADLRGDYRGFVEASKDTQRRRRARPRGRDDRVRALAGRRAGAPGRGSTCVEIDAALERVDAGTYGVCAVCGAPIPDGRLEVRPTAATCVGCATSAAGVAA